MVGWAWVANSQLKTCWRWLLNHTSAHWGNKNFFASSLPLWKNKLECLSTMSIFSLVYNLRIMKMQLCCHIQVGSGIIRKYLIRLKILTIDKHSSLFFPKRNWRSKKSFIEFDWCLAKKLLCGWTEILDLNNWTTKFAKTSLAVFPTIFFFSPFFYFYIYFFHSRLLIKKYVW